jgi:glycosyltransferase involved in cell wall biosynthesis
MSVLIAHPARQHSHRLAKALQDAGLLHSYWTLLPDQRALSWLPTGLIPSAIMRHSLKFLTEDKVHTLMGPLLFQKLASRFASVAICQLGEWMAWTVFDLWVASQLPRLRPKVVVGYEMCSAETFRVAKAAGSFCVLDAAACHYTMQDKLLYEEGYAANTWAGKQLRLRKEREIELADKIICVSELAKNSYVNAGVDESRIVVNPVGCDVTQFVFHGELKKTGAPKFVFVGMPNYRKGFDLLTVSFGRLLAHYPDTELHVVGDPTMDDSLSADNRIRIHGKLSHDQLSKLFVQMDCLVLPSRLESFGMVVVEALAAGVPVIVSDHAGAAVAIRENVNGWVAPAGNEDALFQRMRACCDNIINVRFMGGACTDSALAYDWSTYSHRAVEMISHLQGDWFE